MCLILFGWHAHPDLPLVMAANRDEFRSRTTLPLDRWADLPIIGGRDQRAGGTWMGVHADDPGRSAAVTNVRTGLTSDSPVLAGKRSRGTLPVDFLIGSHGPEEYANRVVADAAHFEPVNLLVADSDELWWVTNWPEPAAARVSPGMHGISNGALDNDWPKVVDGTRRFGTVLAADGAGGDVEPYFAVLRDGDQAADTRLPRTGVPEDFERSLSSIFIDIPSADMPTVGSGMPAGDYGTRASTVLRVGRDGHGDVTERRFVAGGEVVGDTTVDL